MIKTKGGALPRIMECVLSIPGIFSGHFLVVNAVLEVAVRYAFYFENHEEQCAQLLHVFISEQQLPLLKTVEGFFHPNVPSLPRLRTSSSGSLRS